MIIIRWFLLLMFSSSTEDQKYRESSRTLIISFLFKKLGKPWIKLNNCDDQHQNLWAPKVKIKDVFAVF